MSRDTVNINTFPEHFIILIPSRDPVYMNTPPETLWCYNKSQFSCYHTLFKNNTIVKGSRLFLNTLGGVMLY